MFGDSGFEVQGSGIYRYAYRLVNSGRGVDISHVDDGAHALALRPFGPCGSGYEVQGSGFMLQGPCGRVQVAGLRVKGGASCRVRAARRRCLRFRPQG